MPQTAAGQPTDAVASEDLQTASGRMSAAFAANYRQVQYHYVQFLCEHLVDCSRTFGGDLDQVIILAILGQRFMDAANQPGRSSTDPPEAIWMPAMRIADVTGLPRETVRRKLKALEARGWARQEAGKGWAMVGGIEANVARQDLSGLDRRGQARLARLYVAIQQILKDQA